MIRAVLPRCRQRNALPGRLTLPFTAAQWKVNLAAAATLIFHSHEEIVARTSEVVQVAVRYRFAEQLVTTSRGYNYLNHAIIGKD